MHELRFAFRLLLKQPLVTAATLLALAVGIGMATTGFALVDSVLYSKLPFPNGDRFVLLEVHTEPEAQRTGLDPERFRYFAEHASTFEHLGMFRGAAVNLELESGEVVPVTGASVTPGSIGVFPYEPVVGRTLKADDGRPGSPPVALVRESLWRRHYSSDPKIVGAMVTVSGIRRTVVGIMPDAFEFPNSSEIWLPIVDDGSAGSVSSGRIFGVLKRGTDPATATAQTAALLKGIEDANPGAPRLRIVVVRFTEAVSRGLELLAVVLVTCLLLVLLVIAANIASLVLARTVSRSRELAVRTALGATRGRLIGQVFTEVLIVGAIAAGIGLTVSQAVLAWVRRTVTEMPFWVDFTASPRTMVFAACATLLTACVAGVMPALRATRRDTASVLANDNRGATAGFGILGGLMVVAQVAVSIALLNGALMMARGVAGYMRPTLHVPAHEVLTARVWSQTSTPEAVIRAIGAIPGVIATGASTSLPGLSPATQMTEVEPLEGMAASAPRAAPVVAVDEGFFETFGGRVEGGRLFTPTDLGAKAPPVAIVNRPFVEKFFGGGSPIGKRLRIRSAGAGVSPEPWREIVGVVPDLGLSAGDPNMAAGVYIPMDREEAFHIALRSSGDARHLTGAVRKALNDLDPGIQVREIAPLQDVGRQDRAVFAGIGTALAALGGMALLLSVIATYAILSLSVTRRTREIGVRTALGASRRQVLQSVLGRIILPPAIGAIAGIALGEALVAARGIFAFRLPDGSGPWGLPVLGIITIAAAILAAWVPAKRALAVEPAEALRAE